MSGQWLKLFPLQRTVDLKDHTVDMLHSSNKWNEVGIGTEILSCWLRVPLTTITRPEYSGEMVSFATKLLAFSDYVELKPELGKINKYKTKETAHAHRLFHYYKLQ